MANFCMCFAIFSLYECAISISFRFVGLLCLVWVAMIVVFVFVSIAWEF